jgi:hypothetical protein
MVAWLIGVTGSLLVPGWYLLVATLVGLAAMIGLSPRSLTGRSMAIDLIG